MFGVEPQHPGLNGKPEATRSGLLLEGEQAKPTVFWGLVILQTPLPCVEVALSTGNEMLKQAVTG